MLFCMDMLLYTYGRELGIKKLAKDFLQSQHIDERLERPLVDLIAHAALVSTQLTALRERVSEINASGEPLVVPKQFKTFYECSNCREKMESFEYHKCFSEFEGRN